MSVVALRGSLAEGEFQRERQELAANLAGLMRRGYIALGDRRVTIHFARQFEADQTFKLFELNKKRKRKT